MVKKYFEAEFKFSILLADINKIIAESVEDVLRKNVTNYKVIENIRELLQF